MTQQNLSDSRFQMWRALVSLVHTDHRVTQEERDFFINRFDKIKFSDEQKNTLKLDLENPTDITQMFDSITDKEDKGTFIYFARLLFWCDGEFAHQEDKILKHLHSKVLNKLDLEKIMTSVSSQTKETMSKYDDMMKEKKGLSSTMSALLFALGIGFWPARVIRDMLDGD